MLFVCCLRKGPTSRRDRKIASRRCCSRRSKATSRLPRRCSPLAASYGDVPIMRMLIAAGADPSISTADHTTPLMAAAGVDFVEGQDKYGRRWFTTDTMPLQIRARDAVTYCLELGGDINAANDKG